MAQGATVNEKNGNDYAIVIEQSEKRLIVAKENHDLLGERREHLHLGHAYLYFEDIEKSLYHYREAMNLGQTMKDDLFLAQIHFILGRLYSLKQDYEPSIYFHEKHLQYADEIHDKKGQYQGNRILSELYEKTNQYEKGNQYLRHAQEMMDLHSDSSESKKHLLKPLPIGSRSASVSEASSPYVSRSNSTVGAALISPVNSKSFSSATKKFTMNFLQHWTKKSPLIHRKETPAGNTRDELMDLVQRMQKSRFDDQRCQIPRDHRPSTQLESILSTVDRLQQNRLDDQRTTLPSSNSKTHAARLSPLNEQFFDQLAKCQESRLNDQRAVLLPINHQPSSSSSRPVTTSSTLTPINTKKTSNTDTSPSKTLPDDEFFALFSRAQSHAMDPSHPYSS